MKVGDKVRFLNDVGEGKIVRIIDKKTVSVLNEFGFEVPTLLKELVLIEAAKETPANIPISTNEYDFDSDTQEEQSVKVVSQISYENEILDSNIKVFMAFVPKDESKKQFDMFLINDSDYELLYTISFQNDKKLQFIEANRLEDNTKIHLSILNAESLNQLKAFNFQAIPFHKGTYKYKSLIDATIPINPVKLYKDNIYVENDFLEEDAFVIQINDESYFKSKVEEISKKEIDKVKELKEHFENPLQKNIEAKQRKDFENEMEEVDLHIQELIDKVEGLDNGEKLQIQLDHFQKKLDEAITNRKKRIVFIHGVGNGVLKVRLRNILERQYKHLKFQDASFQQYGYGATIVFLRK